MEGFFSNQESEFFYVITFKLYIKVKKKESEFSTTDILPQVNNYPTMNSTHCHFGLVALHVYLLIHLSAHSVDR